MLRIENLKLSPGGGPFALRNAVLHILRIPEKDLLALHILRRSIDAREGVRRSTPWRSRRRTKLPCSAAAGTSTFPRQPPGPSINSRSL